MSERHHYDPNGEYVESADESNKDGSIHHYSPNGEYKGRSFEKKSRLPNAVDPKLYGNLREQNNR